MEFRASAHDLDQGVLRHGHGRVTMNAWAPPGKLEDVRVSGPAL